MVADLTNEKARSRPIGAPGSLGSAGASLRDPRLKGRRAAVTSIAVISPNSSQRGSQTWPRRQPQAATSTATFYQVAPTLLEKAATGLDSCLWLADSGKTWITAGLTTATTASPVFPGRGGQADRQGRWGWLSSGHRT